MAELQAFLLVLCWSLAAMHLMFGEMDYAIFFAIVALAFEINSLEDK